MHLRRVTVFQGPSPYGQEPVLVADLEGSTYDWAAFVQGVVALRVRQPDGLHAPPENVAPVDDVAAAIWMAQWTRAALNSVRGCIRDAGARREADGVIRVWVGYHVPNLAWQALQLSVRAAWLLGHQGGGEGRWSEVEEALKRLGVVTRQRHPDYQMRFVMMAAHQRGVPVLPLAPEARVWQVGWGARQRVFFESATHADSLVGARLAQKKPWAKQWLTAIGAPVVPHVLVSELGDLPAAVQTIGWPCVLKPLDLGGGKGVSADLRQMDALSEAFAYARQFTDGPVMVERHVPGWDHRLLVVGGRFVSAVRRMSSCVVGDGRCTLRALIDDLNVSRRQADLNNQHWVPVVEDDVFHRHLKNQGFDLKSILPVGKRVTMRSVSNVSMGGRLEYVSDSVHPSIHAMAESIGRASGLNAIGLDYITEDIARDWHVVPGAFVEINTTPGLDGLDVHPGRAPGWLGEVLLGLGVGRVPAVGIVLGRDQWAAWRPALESLVRAPDVGGSGPGWVWANGMRWQDDRLNGNQAAQAMLRHATVQRAVVVGQLEELEKWGWPVDGLQRQWVVGADLPDDWADLANRVAAAVERVESLAALTRGVADWLSIQEDAPL